MWCTPMNRCDDPGLRDLLWLESKVGQGFHDLFLRSELLEAQFGFPVELTPEPYDPVVEWVVCCHGALNTGLCG